MAKKFRPCGTWEVTGKIHTPKMGIPPVLLRLTSQGVRGILFPMLKGISPVVSPELLKVLAEMGHGDEIVLADAHFPGHTLGRRVLRADGLRIAQLLDGIIPLLELDAYAPPLVMMRAVRGDRLDPRVEREYVEAMGRHLRDVPKIARIARHAFYARAAKAYAVVVTGETAIYGNIVLKKGVTPIHQ